MSKLPDFSYLQKLEVQEGKTRELTLSRLEGDPVLIGVFAGERNPKYLDALTIEAARMADKRPEGEKNTVQDFRTQDRNVFPGSTLTGWRNVVDTAGNPVEFSDEACKSYLWALPDRIMDKVRNFFLDAEEFIDGAGDKVAATELGNDSPPDFDGN